MHINETHRLGSAILALSLSLPSIPQDALAQNPLPQTPSTKTPSQPRVKNALSHDTITKLATDAHVGLTVLQELSPGFASGVLVQPPDGMAQFLHEDEVLVLSVSHNFTDWSHHTRVRGTLYSPNAKSGNGLTLERTNYEARLIGRFVNTNEERSFSAPRSVGVDVAFLALTKIPQEQLEAIKSRALPIASAEHALPRAGTTIFAAGSPESEPHPSGKGRMVSKPHIGKGIVLNPNSRAGIPALVTQFGEIADHCILTNEQCIPGESGGGLLFMNEVTGRLEVIGVCTGGCETPSGPIGWIDFPPELAGVTEEDIAKYGIERATLRKISQAKSPHRGSFTGVLAARALAEALVAQYEEKCKDLERIDSLHLKLANQFSSSSDSKATILALDELHRKARERIISELHGYKPIRE